MDLKKIVSSLYLDSERTPTRGLSAIAEAENYLQQAYQGRYLFELIQNARDAIKLSGRDGEIVVELNENILSIANTGVGFSEKGIEGITTIGRSTKRGQDFIGFKGIGFKAVQEITETPRIVTRYGTIVFDRDLTIDKYVEKNEQIELTEIPLFYFPHYSDKYLSDESGDKTSFVTRIELPLKQSVTSDDLREELKGINIRQLILLGSIKRFTFNSGSWNISYDLAKIPSRNLLSVTSASSISRFKIYSPKNRIAIPSEIIDGLDLKEKKIFGDDASIDATVLLEIDTNWKLILTKDAPLYLFYPLEILSGFRFLIHSYFIVNPERKELRQSPLNSFLLKSIGLFIGTEMLNELRNETRNTAEILTFRRIKNSKLNDLYDSLVDCLKKEKFIFHSKSRTYLGINEVVIADDFDKGLFRDGKIADKYIIYMDDAETIDWLRSEFDVAYLTYARISEEIEKECLRQSTNRRDVSFFQNLYNYVSSHTELNLRGKKVLLTDKWKLASDEDDVIYRGREKFPLYLSDAIKDHIYFIHRDIKISDLRDGKSRTGIIEFNTYELVKRLLKLFSMEDVPKVDILNALLNLDLDIKSELEVRERILLPVKGKEQWISPITTTIYFESDELRELYPTANFIDEQVLEIRNREASKEAFLKLCGVWEIPGIYIQNDKIILDSLEGRVAKLRKATNVRSGNFSIVNDRVLDIPVKFNSWFMQAIIDNWTTYRDYITSETLPKFDVSNNVSRYLNLSAVLDFTHFAEVLRSQKWITFNGDPNFYSPSDIIGVDPIDFQQGHNQVIKRHLLLLPINNIHYSEIVQSLDIIHLDSPYLTNFIRLFEFIHQKNKNEAIISSKDFTDFFNRMLGKLFDYFHNRKPPNLQISPLAETYFLSHNELTKLNSWNKAKDIFYLDDKPAYDILPVPVKALLQPHFTNKDRNTFGKIAAQIGRKISDSLSKELVTTEQLKEQSIMEYYPSLCEYAAILEVSADTVLSKKNFEAIRKLKVFETAKIEVKIKTGSAELVIDTEHFIDGSGNIHVINSLMPERNKLNSIILNELFIQLLSIDLRKFRMDVLLYLDANDKASYLRTYQIDDVRVNEIREQLNFVDLTANQRFWDAILSAKGVIDRDNLFNEDAISIEVLSKLIFLNKDELQTLNQELNFNSLSDVKNIPLLFQLFNDLDLAVSKVNEFLFPKIDFRNYYVNQLTQIKNKFQKIFEAMLYNKLRDSDINSQISYQSILDIYKYSFKVDVPGDLILINSEEYLIEAINTEFPLLTVSLIDLKVDYSDFKPTEIYSSNLILLQAHIRDDYKASQLDLFLQNNKMRSLLYFGNIEFVSAEFTAWLDGVKINDSNKATGYESVVLLLSERNEGNIETVKTSADEPSVPRTNKRNGGRRTDGSASDQHKKDVGFAAELVVYELLAEKFKDVLWVSNYATKVSSKHPGFNPEGDDILGYDIEYLDEIGNKHFVEVKGRKDGSESFEIKRNEIETAQGMPNNYRVIFVSFALDNSRRRVRDLGNLFLFEDGDDFFNNKKFTPLFSNFEIRFHLS